MAQDRNIAAGEEYPCDAPERALKAYEPPKSLIERIKDLKKSKEDRLLEKYGVVYEGKLTHQGVTLVAEKLLPQVKSEIVEDLKKLEEKDKKAKK